MIKHALWRISRESRPTGCSTKVGCGCSSFISSLFLARLLLTTLAVAHGGHTRYSPYAGQNENVPAAAHLLRHQFQLDYCSFVVRPRSSSCEGWKSPG